MAFVSTLLAKSCAKMEKVLLKYTQYGYGGGKEVFIIWGWNRSGEEINGKNCLPTTKEEDYCKPINFYRNHIAICSYLKCKTCIPIGL